MSDFERGPIDEYEVILRTGAVLHVKAHQVSWPGGLGGIGSLFSNAPTPTRPARVVFHGEVDGKWKLMLDVLEEDVLSIRNVTHVGDAP